MPDLAIAHDDHRSSLSGIYRGPLAALEDADTDVVPRDDLDFDCEPPTEELPANVLREHMRRREPGGFVDLAAILR